MTPEPARTPEADLLNQLRDHEIYAEQVKQVSRVAPLGNIASIVNSFIAFLILRQVLPEIDVAGWFAAVVLLTVTRMLLALRYRQSKPDLIATKKWGKILVSGWMLSGILWGGIAFSPFTDMPLAYQVFLLFLLGGMAAGAAATFSPIRGGYLAFAVPALLPLTIRFALMGDQVHYGMAVMLFLFGVILWRVSHQSYATNRTSLALRFENQEMIRTLEKAKDHADMLYRDLLEEMEGKLRAEAEIRAQRDRLERMVDERTAELVRANELLRAEIEERKAAEQALRTIEERLDLAQKAGHVGVFDRDLVSGRLVWTEQMEELFGIPPGSFEGTHEAWTRRVHPEDLPGIESRFRIWIKEHQHQVELEYRCIRPDGRVRWMAARARIHYFEDGTPSRMIGTNLDITERKILEERLERRNTELNELNRELEAFSYSVAHDLRAPLRIMEGFAKTLQEEHGASLDPAARNFVERISASAQKMDRIIRDLFTLSKIARQELSIRNVDLCAIVDEVAHELSARETERRVRFVVGRGYTVKADGSLLKIAIENLLGNAWKFTSKTPDPTVEFGAEEREDGRVYYIRDNGTGFDMAYADKLFVPFQRLHSEREFPGTGIGLATVARIIKRMGGEIWAESAPGKGATFFFTLPGGKHP